MTNKSKKIVLIILLLIVTQVAFYYYKKQRASAQPEKIIVAYDEDSLAFDSKVWNRPTDYIEGTRHYMLQDLMDNYLKQGMDTIAIKELLGEPWSNRDKIYYYQLGYYRELDPVYLILKLDAEGKMIKAIIQEI